MHILFIADNFPPEVNAPASRTFEHCREWVRCGHRVTVVTSAPNFPRGAVFPGYRNAWWSREEMGGIRVVRVWTYITANEGFVRRTLDYVSFMLSGSIAALFQRRVDVVVGTSPQFFTVCAAWFVGALKRRPFVFELRDLWPESIRVVGAMRSERLLHILERVELFLYRRAAVVVAVTRAFREDLARRGIAPAKVAVITNGVDLSRFSPRAKDAELVERFGLSDRFVAGYIGTHGMAHGLQTLLDAAALLARRPDAGRFHIVLLGDGAVKQELVAKSEALGLRNVSFLDSVPKSEVVRYWSLLDVCIIHLRKAELFHGVIPSKLFESMGMGIPVIHAVPGESAQIVEQEGVGITVPPEDPTALASAIVRLANDASERKRMASCAATAARRYDRTALAQALLEVLMRTRRQRRSIHT